MRLIVGLGNPGPEYKNTRHNLGRKAVNRFAAKKLTSHFQANEKFKADIIDEVFHGEKIIIAKPLTFMNQSGQAVKTIADYFKILPADILIIHDDLDIALGQVKLQKNRGSAGHNGVQSVIDHLKTKDFLRIRIGIQPEEEISHPEKFVLEKIKPEEDFLIKEAIKKATALIAEAF